MPFPRPRRVLAAAATLAALACSTDPSGPAPTPRMPASPSTSQLVACPPSVPAGYTLVYCFDFDFVPGVWHGFIVHSPGLPNALTHDYLLISPTTFGYVVPGTVLDVTKSNYTFQPEFNGTVWYDVVRLMLSNQLPPQRITLAVARRVLTPQLQVSGLSQQVNALATAGTLSTGNANALNQKLLAAIAALNLGDAVTATNNLTAFMNQVRAMMSGGSPRLTPAQGQALIDAAQAVIARITP